MVIILDTNIIIDHLRLKGQDSVQFSLINSHLDDSFSISPITIQELYSGASTLRKSPLSLLNQTLSELDILMYSQKVAEIAGKIMRDYHPSFADAAIAATAIHYGAHLATLNTKDFVGIPNLKILKLPYV
ncbi:MAG: hypothetical protein DPW11_01065 [bacterium]|nr:type II toxin-antitoxin system VapC family toxin [Candidatus Microgenomates bacterium CPR3]MCQ3944357.1 hypothetical protein [bacterium]RIK51294.1 MAG: hypothetical protein DCC61_02930 [Candidatus Microgenomates bacterium]